MQTTAPERLRSPPPVKPGLVGAKGTALTRPSGAAPRAPRRINWSLLSFLLITGLPTVLAGVWMYGFVSDQYESEFRYVVRRVAPATGTSPTAMTAAQGTVPQMAILADSEMLVQYTLSRAAMEDVEATVPLDPIFTRAEVDWWARWQPGLAVEDRVRHWRSVVSAHLDLNSSVVTIRVRAFQSDDARRLAGALLASSENLVNGLSRRSQADALALTNREVEMAERGLSEIRKQLGEFRNRNEILTPQMLGNVQAEVLARLRQALAEARATLAAMTDGGVLSNAPQARLARSRITALEGELETERRQLGSMAERSGQRDSIASVLTAYAELEGNERIALQNLERALSAQSRARIEAMAQGVYLNTFIQPMEAGRSTFPRRGWFVSQVLLVSLACWAILALMWATIRDQRH